MNDIRFRLDVPVGPKWNNIDPLRVSILSCLTTLFQDSGFCEAVGMVASELLENAIKYGDWSLGEKSRFTLLVYGTGAEVTVEVVNPVDPDAGAGKVLEMIDWINSFADPGAAYQARLLELAEDPARAGKSQLGLVRVAYEGNCRLEAVAEGASLRVRATAFP